MPVTMSGSIFFYLNGQARTVRPHEAFLTLAQYLRQNAGATGTKIVCEEGDCGSCTVLVGRPDGDALRYAPLNSCIQFVYHANGTHIVTVEGLAPEGALHPVQEAMIACHGAQCGYCTPGFVVAMCALAEQKKDVSEKDVKDALTGNLCRCTGYTPIIKAAMSVDQNSLVPMSERYPDRQIAAALTEHLLAPVDIESSGRRIVAPDSIAEAVRFKSDHPDVVIVQGATDIGVQHNKRHLRPEVSMNLSRIAELQQMTVEGSVLSVGAAVTLARIEAFMRERVPEFFAILWLFGAPQIKNAGTLAGNLANASPIADSIPFLYVMEASIEVIGLSGVRRIPLESFYLGYKKLDLAADEIITRILIPLPDAEILKLYKVSKRKNLDISTVTAAFRLSTKEGAIDKAHVAVGGVGPTVLRLRKVEEFLHGRPWSLETMLQAGEIARSQITPLSDVRGSAEFRLQLIGNLFERFFLDTSDRRASWAS